MAYDESDRGRPWLRSTVALLAVLIACKVVDLAPSWPVRRGFLSDVLVASHEDLVVGVVLGSFFGVLGWALRPWPRLVSVSHGVFVAIGALTAAYAVVACRAYAFLWGPITYRLVALAGGLAGLWSSARGALTPLFLVGFFGALACFLAATRGPAWRSPGHPWVAPLLSVLFVVAALVTAQEGATTFAKGWTLRLDAPVALSPHLALLRSFGSRPDASGPAPLRGLSFAFGERETRDFARPFPSPAPVTTKSPRGVILYVMESVGAEYLDAYGATLGVSPRFSEIVRGGTLYEHAYSNMGRTEGALATLLLSQYLPFSWHYFTEEHADVTGTTLAQSLAAKGFRTSLLTAGKLAYAAQDRFLAGRGFVRAADAELLGCPPVSIWGASDACVVNATLAEIDAVPAAPFFLVVWTNQTHHPYPLPPGARPRPRDEAGEAGTADPVFEAYLDALADADRQLGRLFDGLAERGLRDDVLLVVTGDHGEAFRHHHPAVAHGFRLDDDETRIPLLFHWPAGLGPGHVDGRVCSQIDVTPTMAHLLGLPQDASWFGRSVFDPARPDRAYLFASSRLLTMGVREAQWKLTLEPEDGHTELYDLDSDPFEQQNLATARTDVVNELGRRLAAWVAVDRATWRQGAIPLRSGGARDDRP